MTRYNRTDEYHRLVIVCGGGDDADSAQAEVRRQPRDLLKDFTDREDSLAVFRRHLHRPPGDGPPVLMFYGVGGRGKSWLLRRLCADLAEDGAVPSAFIDLDPALQGARFHHDLGALLAEVWRQLDVECPRFELAYAMMRFKQGAGDQPLLRHGGKPALARELVAEAAPPSLSGVPGGNLIVWIGRKAVDAAADQAPGHRAGPAAPLLCWQRGLPPAQPADRPGYPPALSRAARPRSLRAASQCPDRSCRAVAFLDTFEALRGSDFGELQRSRAEENVRALFSNLPALLVLAGRDRLTWDEVDPGWDDSASLEQHLLGGLSAQDAASFLAKCDHPLGATPGGDPSGLPRCGRQL